MAASRGSWITACTSNADIAATRGQMDLFDRLISADGTPKVVDVGHTAFRRFMSVAREINYFAEARRRRIETVILYVVETEKSSLRAFAKLPTQGSDVTLVPVINDGLKISREPLPKFRREPLRLWIARVFLQFRELELRLLMDKLRKPLSEATASTQPAAPANALQTK